ncbi:hypothetical protein [Shewanella surugensis]|uniref:Uncharacterized protein n=1 Tax=Shewanella surugensis TaxID=212020 RepID=A0ABT0LH51_9GAMM|nr:hypothetical protein [Shewanella surugensis]MCL1126894.1 hypothetical protein [Shewanella surugensis]
MLVLNAHIQYGANDAYFARGVHPIISWENDYSRTDWSDLNQDNAIAGYPETGEEVTWNKSEYEDDNLKSLCKKKSGSGSVMEGSVDVLKWDDLSTWRSNAKNAGFGTKYDGIMQVNIPAGSALLNGKTLDITEDVLDLEVDLYATMIRRNNGSFKDISKVAIPITISGVDDVAVIPDAWSFPAVVGAPAVYDISDNNRIACLAVKGSSNCLNATSADKENVFPTSITRTDEYFETLTMLRCGSATGYEAEQGYTSLLTQSGTDGYSDNGWCSQLNNLTRSWKNVISSLGQAWIVSENPYTATVECLSQGTGSCLNKNIITDKAIITSALGSNTSRMKVEMLTIDTSTLCHYKDGQFNTCPTELLTIFD